MTPDQQLELNLKRFAHERPRFPDGRIDYTNAREAPVILCCVVWNGKVLIVKRSDAVLTYKGKWNFVGGYCDTLGETVEARVRTELREELAIDAALIDHITLAAPYSLRDEDIAITWHIYPACAVLRERPTVSLDWEHTDHRWVEPSAMPTQDLVPGSMRCFERFAHLLKK